MIVRPGLRRGSLGGNGIPSLNLSFTSATLDSRITWTRASTKTYYDIAGVRQTAAINEAPLEYDPVTHAPLGRSVWEARTNSLLNSDAPATQNVTLGTGTFTLWVEGTGSATSAAGTAIGSGFGAATAGSPNTFTVSTGGTVSVTVSGSVTVFQLENGAFPTPYIPTTGTAATRAADVATMTGTSFSDWYNQSEGTMYADVSIYTAVGSFIPCLFGVDDTTSANRIQLFRSNNSGTPFGGFVSVAGSAVQANMSAGSSQLQPAKIAGAYKVNDYAVSLDGAAVVTDTTATVPTVTRATIGSGTALAALNGYIRSIKYYRSRLSDTQLQALTA